MRVARAAIALALCARHAAAQAPNAPACADSGGYGRDVAVAWRAVRDRYAYLADKAVDWPRAGARAAAAVDTVRSQRALIGVLEPLIETLYDPHATLRANTRTSPRLVPVGADLWAEWRGGDAVVTAVRPGFSADQAGVRPGMRVLAIDGVPVEAAAAARLGPAVRRPAPAAARAWALLSALAGRHGTPRTLRVRDLSGVVRDLALDQPGQQVVDAPPESPPIEFRRLTQVAGVVGYVRLNALADTASVAAFDSALTALRDARALVLDLRNTPGGGSTDVAEPILGRLVARALGYQRVVPRGGAAYVRSVRPRGPWTYIGPVVALVGRWTGSMGEGMAIGLDGMRRATVVGTPMAGLAGSVEDVALPCSGIVVGLPTERLLHVDGTPRERWRPPVLVELATAGGEDPVLARGVRVALGAKGLSLSGRRR